MWQIHWMDAGLQRIWPMIVTPGDGECIIMNKRRTGVVMEKEEGREGGRGMRKREGDEGKTRTKKEKEGGKRGRGRKEGGEEG